METLLQEKLSSYEDKYWDFEGAKRDGIHGLVSYPAMMVAPMQHQIIKDIVTIEGNIKNIFDPFHGSGTTLVEGKKLGLNLIGIDLNPLANLITKVKINGVDKKTIYNSIEGLIYNIKKFSHNDFDTFWFNNIQKWFREDIIADLTLIRNCIILEKNEKNRLYFWVCLIDLIRKYSNTRSSTFKLHIKEEEKIRNMKNRLIEDYISKIRQAHLFLGDSYENYSLVQGDSLIEMEKMKDESIELICTSPPYGDNGTTVTYGQFSILSLFWIDKKDLSISDEYLLSNYSAIDTSSLGGKQKSKESLEFPMLLNNILALLSEEKKKKITSFFYDYFKCLIEMIRVLKTDHLMILTLGNRRVDNIEISLDKITEEFCLTYGMSVEGKIARTIPRKRMPRKISNVDGYGAVSSMNKENVLVFRKGR